MKPDSPTFILLASLGLQNETLRNVSRLCGVYITFKEFLSTDEFKELLSAAVVEVPFTYCSFTTRVFIDKKRTSGT